MTVTFHANTPVVDDSDEEFILHRRDSLCLAHHLGAVFRGFASFQER